MVSMTVAWAILGILTWPLLEYVFHRYLGHQWKAKTLFRKEHQTHHAVRDFFAPAIYKLAAAAVFFSILVFVVHAPAAYSLGLAGMYLFYEWTHYSFHMFAPKTRLGAKLRKHHFYHHFMNAQKNFGVTTTIFDIFAGTNVKTLGAVTVPKLFTLRWLVNQDSQIKPEFKNDYTLK